MTRETPKLCFDKKKPKEERKEIEKEEERKQRDNEDVLKMCQRCSQDVIERIIERINRPSEKLKSCQVTM